LQGEAYAPVRVLARRALWALKRACWNSPGKAVENVFWLPTAKSWPESGVLLGASAAISGSQAVSCSRAVWKERSIVSALTVGAATRQSATAAHAAISLRIVLLFACWETAPGSLFPFG